MAIIDLLAKILGLYYAPFPEERGSLKTIMGLDYDKGIPRSLKLSTALIPLSVLAVFSLMFFSVLIKLYHVVLMFANCIQ